MISFSLDDEARSYLERLRSFIEKQVTPLERQLAIDEELVTGRVWDEVLPSLRAEARAANIYLPQLPAELGGLGLNLTALALAAELCGPYRLAPLAINCMAPDEGNMHLLEKYGTPEQRERWLRPLAEGAIRSCFGMTEPDAGSDPRRMVSRADRTPGGRWRINARKVFTSGAFGASVCLLMAVTDDNAPPGKGQTLFLVPADAEGYEIVRDIRTLGNHGLGGHPETRWTDVIVGDDAILGIPGQGFEIAQSRLGAGRMGHAMRWIGVAQRCLDLAVARSQSRVTFGQPLADRQAIQWWFADAASRLYAARLMVLHTCWLIESGLPHRTEVSMVKTTVAETLGDITDKAIQVFGGWGVTEDHPIEGWYRDARAARLYDGPSEVHRMFVARRVLAEVRRAGTSAAVGNVLW